MHKRKKTKQEKKEEKKEMRETDLIANEYSLYLLLPFLHSEQKRSKETDDKE